MIIGANLIKCLPGQIADTTSRTILSFSAEEVIEFGRPLMRGTDKERQCKNFVEDVAGLNKFLGISVRDPNKISGSYAIKDTVAVMDVGRIWVALTAGMIIVAGQTAYTDGQIITNTPGAGNIDIGRFHSSGTSNGLTGSVLFDLELIPGFQQ